jgi:alcohol dehydrogenase
MKTTAAVLFEMQRPTPYELSRPLSIEEVELAAPGTGEVLVEVASAGLCHSDLSTISGVRPWPMPMVLGHEASGIVREVGPEVRGLAPADHVVFSYVPTCGRCVPCASGRPALCEPGLKANRAGTLLSGRRCFSDRSGRVLHHHLGVAAFSQFTVAAQESLVKIDSIFPLDKAALFGCAVLTGVGAVVNTARVPPGARVAVFGLGGVGLSAVMGARAAGAAVIIAVDPLEEKRQLARRLGATHVLDPETDEPVAALKDLTAGGPDYTFECAGSETVLEQAYQATRRGGTTVAIGLPHPSKTVAIPAVSLVAEERTLKGSYMGSAVPRRDIPRFMAMYQAGRLPVDLLVTRTIRLEEINAAFDALATGQAVRQLVALSS